jgi:hypothetical protein
MNIAADKCCSGCGDGLFTCSSACQLGEFTGAAEAADILFCAHLAGQLNQQPASVEAGCHEY